MGEDTEFILKLLNLKYLRDSWVEMSSKALVSNF